MTSRRTIRRGGLTEKALIVLPLLVFGGHVSADDSDNDRILRGDKGDYIEVFKKDSAGGKKNYLYTISGFKDEFGRECTVVSGDSEKTLALDCDRPVG